MKAAKFRQNGRFPVLSYYHKENGVSRLLSVVYIKHVLGSFSFQVNINFCFMYTVVQKRLSYLYNCSFYKCWLISTIFGTRCTELICNITVIDLPTSSTCCCYTTLGSMFCQNQRRHICFIQFARWRHRGRSLPSPTASCSCNAVFCGQMSILRCSQPSTGTSGRRCREDEIVVNSVVGIGRRGYILDTRSLSVVKLATSKGS